MLRLSEKKELLNIIELSLELIEKGLPRQEHETQVSILQEVQEAIALIKNKLQIRVEDAVVLNKLLDELGQELHGAARKEGIVQEEINSISEKLDHIRFEVERIAAKYQVVFFPYKASMWDSLESIWLACKADSRCEAYVVPIPYFEKEDDKMIMRYEGADFPKDVPICDYQEFALEEENPDVVYVHNPYDEYNCVTSIHPDYYSRNIKRYAKNLVYVPYYVTGGRVSYNQRNQPIYQNMDYMVAQSPLFKEGFVETPFYDKVIPLGSPKFDRVINYHKLHQNNAGEKKRRLLLNTSLNCFVADGELQIQKLKFIFDKVKERKDTLLVWRPHPLLEATIGAMRPHLKSLYEELKTYFLQENIGELDTSSDVTKAVALADGYVGESASSLVHLFGAAGKPIFFLDNYIYKEYSDEEKRRLLIMDMVEYDGRYFFISSQCNGLFSVKKGDWNHIQFHGRIEGQANWVYGSINIKMKGDSIYFSPYDTKTIVKYNVKKECYEEVKSNFPELLCVRRIVEYKDKIFYIQNYADAIVEYDIRNNVWKEYTSIFEEIKKDYDNKDFVNMWDCCVYENKIWMTTIYSNKIMSFDMETGKCEYICIGEKRNSYSSICADLEYLYLAEVHSGDIVKVNMNNKSYTIFKMPVSLTIQDNSSAMVHANIVSLGDWIITMPHGCSEIIKINKITGESKLILLEFCEAMKHKWNGYHAQDLTQMNFAKKLDEKTILLQRSCDKAMAIVNVETEDYELVYPSMDENAYLQFMRNQDGFEKINEGSSFACKESQWFEFNDFLDIFGTEKQEDICCRQKIELQEMAANLDGTSGEKIHQFVMSSFA